MHNAQKKYMDFRRARQARHQAVLNTTDTPTPEVETPQTPPGGVIPQEDQPLTTNVDAPSVDGAITHHSEVTPDVVISDPNELIMLIAEFAAGPNLNTAASDTALPLFQTVAKSLLSQGKHLDATALELVMTAIDALSIPTTPDEPVEVIVPDTEPVQ
jgi:hypothetical protein